MSTPNEPACKFPKIKRDSIPASGHEGAWLVQKVENGWVSLISADLKCKLKMTVDRFNRHCDELEQAARRDLLERFHKR